MTLEQARQPMEGDTTARMGGTGLLVLVVFCVFVISVLPVTWHRMLYSLSYTAIFILAALALGRHRRLYLGLAVGMGVLEGLAHGLGMEVLRTTSQIATFLFFLFVVGRFIAQIARTHAVNARVIMTAINGYLLLGLAASIAVAMVEVYTPDAISFPTADVLPGGEAVSQFSNHLYFGFVTLTTLGYGDVVPRTPYAKSLAILIGVMGQMYVAIIIATLVGKWASAHRK